MQIKQIMKEFKLTWEEVYKACDSMGIEIQSGIDEYRGFNDGAIVNGKKVFHHTVRFNDDEVIEWSDVEWLHDYACGFLGFDPCKQNQLKTTEVFIMQQTQYAKNGQLVSAVKNYEELTAEEKEALVIPASNELSDYANFQVRYNKKGELLGVKPHDFSESKNAAIEKQTQEPDLIDGLQVLFNKNNHSKQYQSAKKRLDVTNEQINEARKVINRG